VNRSCGEKHYETSLRTASAITTADGAGRLALRLLGRGVVLLVAGGGPGVKPGRLPLSRQRDLPRSFNHKSKASENRQVSVQTHALDPANPEVGKRVVALQESELSLDRSALRVARDAREHPAPDTDGQDWAACPLPRAPTQAFSRGT
jgi:hypothetical protein